MDTRRSESTLNSSNGHALHEVQVALEGPYLVWAKPTLDRLVGLFLLLVASPIILGVALVVAATMGPPVIYSQIRIGLDGVPFMVYKFRTMGPDRRGNQQPFPGEDRRVNHKSPDDPRHTKVGRFLRAARLDELPQLWNVVKGDMSLVGPRPEVPSVVAGYEPWQHQRHLVKPGLTGLWQVSDQNGKPMHECTEIDLEYLRQIGFFQDLSILARTPLAMLGKRRGH